MMILAQHQNCTDQLSRNHQRLPRSAIVLYIVKYTVHQISKVSSTVRKDWVYTIRVYVNVPRVRGANCCKT
jgi:hypothetical protein